jgi:hypothetical protein
MTRNVEGPGASDAETLEQRMPQTVSHGEAEHRANERGRQVIDFAASERPRREFGGPHLTPEIEGALGGQVVNFADLQHERQRVFDVPHGTEGLETEADHANAFNKSLGRTVGLTVYRGMVCISAKRRFPRRYEAWVRDTLNCSRAYAFKCKEIAKNPFLANASSWKHLPPSMTALYELSSIPPERLQVLAEGGELHAKLEISEAVELAEAETGDVYRPRPKRAPVRPVPIISEADEDDDEVTDADETDEADTDNGNPGAGGEDQEPDAERLAIDAADTVEDYKITRARRRRTVDHICQHGDAIARGLLAAGLRELAAALNRDADEIDPPAPAQAQIVPPAPTDDVSEADDEVPAADEGRADGSDEERSRRLAAEAERLADQSQVERDFLLPRCAAEIGAPIATLRRAVSGLLRKRAEVTAKEQLMRERQRARKERQRAKRLAKRAARELAEPEGDADADAPPEPAPRACQRTVKSKAAKKKKRART